jgi:hypothetical protein
MLNVITMVVQICSELHEIELIKGVLGVDPASNGL